MAPRRTPIPKKVCAQGLKLLTQALTARKEIETLTESVFLWYVVLLLTENANRWRSEEKVSFQINCDDQGRRNVFEHGEDRFFRNAPSSLYSKLKGQFSEPTHHVQWLRNIWMVPMLQVRLGKPTKVDKSQSTLRQTHGER